MRSRKVFPFHPGLLGYPFVAPAAEPWIERATATPAIVIEMQGAFYPSLRRNWVSIASIRRCSTSAGEREAL